jgi:hypothetical protein
MRAGLDFVAENKILTSIIRYDNLAPEMFILPWKDDK